jgi:hypothetical protein
MYTIQNYKIPTQLTEMTVGQFEKISDIINDQSLLPIERYIDALEALGVPQYIIDDITDEELFEIVKSFNSMDTLPTELVRTFEHKGYTYVAYEDEFKLKAMDMAKIEKELAKNKEIFSSIIAILFKRVDLTRNEHYTDAHIKLKKDIAKGLNANDFYPYVVEIIKRLANKMKQDVTTEVTE